MSFELHKSIIERKNPMSNDKFYLNCPFSEKDLVKSIGGRWDSEARQWYVPSELEPKDFKRWWPKDTKEEKSSNLYVVK